MKNDWKIVKEKVATTIIGGDGNWHCNTDNSKCCFLKNENDEIISHQYQCMLYLGDDHFAVSNVMYDIQYFMDEYSVDDRYYGILHQEYEVNNPKLKWGVIKVNRNEQGIIIPGAEIMVIPYIYDRITENNLKTATAYCNGKLTYLDIDRDNENYGQQLVPCVLELAIPFSTKYDNFAECCINGISGYLPRNCKIKKSIAGKELLTNNQTRYLSKYLNSESDFVLGAETISAYFNLTGIRLPKEKGHSLVKRKK